MKIHSIVIDTAPPYFTEAPEINDLTSICCHGDSLKLSLQKISLNNPSCSNFFLASLFIRFLNDGFSRTKFYLSSFLSYFM